jgi:predicted permease
MLPNVRWIHRVTALLRPNRLHRDLDDELQFHLEARTRDNIARGMTAEEARLDAARRFGNPTATAERMRDIDVNRWLDATLRNLRYSARMMRRNPGFSAVVVASIALGIGANTAIFSLLNAVLLKTLPVKNPQELVTVQSKARDSNGEDRVAIISTLDYRNFQDHAGQYLEMFTTSATSAVMTMGDLVEQIGVAMVPGNYYSVLGVQPFLGRLIGPEDDSETDPHLVAVLSYDFWRSRFGGDRSVAGRQVVLNGISYAIVGVAPRGLLGTSLDMSPGLTVPVRTESYLQPGSTSFRSIQGRLRPDVSRQQAESVLTSLFQAANHRHDVIVLTDNSRGDYAERDRFKTPLYVLMAAVMLVLLIACANVASLFLARGTARRREISIRLAIGAGRASIMSQLLTESLSIALCGGVVGIALAYVADAALLAIFSQRTHALPLDIRPDGRVLTFTTCVSLLTGLLVGLFPAFQAARTELNPSLKRETGIVGGRPRLVARRALVVVQVALSLMLLSGAGLFARTLGNLRTFDAGYDRRGVLLATFEPGHAYSRERMYQLRDDMLERVRAIPGVLSAGVASTPVLSPGAYLFPLIIEGRAQPCEASMTIASPGYLETMRMSLVAGRLFTARDNQVSAPTRVIINQEIARRCFGAESPIGRRVKAGHGKDSEIIGVVADAKYRDLRESALPMYYVPPRSVHPFGLVLHVRAAIDPPSLTTPIRLELRAIDPGILLTGVRTLEEQSERGLLQDRLIATVSATFGFGGLALASVGVYGVLAFMVARRTNEIGIRMALGARRPDVLRLILGETMQLLLLGVVLGVAGAYAGRTLIQGLLFGVSASDQWSVLGAAGVLSGAALLASLIPAGRASRIDPMAALRHE